MATPRDFNQTVFDLLRDLCDVMPHHTELQLAKTLGESLFHAQQDNTLLAQKFYEFTRGKQEAIRQRDSQVLLDTLATLVPRPQMLKSLWEELSESNQEIVFSYIDRLYDMAMEIHEHPGGNIVSAPSSSEGNALYEVYNKMWKEFLGNVLETHPEDVDLQESLKRLEGLLSSKGESTDLIHALLSEDMTPVLPEMVPSRQNDLMKYMLPPDNPVENLEEDTGVIGACRFRLSRNMSFGDLLERVITSSEVVQLATYWHFLKMITFTVKSCPPEMLTMISGLATSLMQGMQQDKAC